MPISVRQLVLCSLVFVVACGGTSPGASTDAGTDVDAGGSVDAGTDTDAGSSVCDPGASVDCYSGPEGTVDIGACKAGKKTCLADGTGYGACEGEVTPKEETCLTPADDDCDGQTNESGEGCVCVPNEKSSCYTGPNGTENVGLCKGSEHTCNETGTGFGPCEGEIVPQLEDCATAADEDCDGQVTSDAEDGCACVPGATADCYTGPGGTKDVGLCKGGQQTCNPDGLSWGACAGEVLPSLETCATPGDEDCDGQANEDGAGCSCMPGASQDCYSADATTRDVGPCKGGTQVCASSGTGYEACMGEVTPKKEDCTTTIDEDCDGQTLDAEDGCVCVPGTMQGCYTGAVGTKDVGLCKGGQQTCNTDGKGWGACIGQVTPQAESCLTPGDDNCNGQSNEGCICTPNSSVSCYDGSAGTQGVGLCHSGTKTCNAQGTAYGACTGQVLPTTESCSTTGDDDCDGQVNEGCVCVPNSTASCYSGPAGTAGVGLCHGGTKTCNALGTAYGACTGEVLPTTESCSTPGDDSCDGQVNEGCPAAPTYATDAKPIFQAHCAGCHGGGGSGGQNIATSYADTQRASGYCAGKTIGECALVRIQNGSMPQGAGCSGNPATDSGNSACLTAAEQATLQAWIAGGQMP